MLDYYKILLLNGSELKKLSVHQNDNNFSSSCQQSFIPSLADLIKTLSKYKILNDVKECITTVADSTIISNCYIPNIGTNISTFADSDFIIRYKQHNIFIAYKQVNNLQGAFHNTYRINKIIDKSIFADFDANIINQKREIIKDVNNGIVVDNINLWFEQFPQYYSRIIPDIAKINPYAIFENIYRFSLYSINSAFLSIYWKPSTIGKREKIKIIPNISYELFKNGVNSKSQLNVKFVKTINNVSYQFMINNNSLPIIIFNYDTVSHAVTLVSCVS